MTEQQIKKNIEQALAGFHSGSLAEKARALFGVMGYRSERYQEPSPNTPENFVSEFDPNHRLKSENKNALLKEWKSVDLLFQLTGDEIRDTEQARLLFGTDKKVDRTRYESYLLFAVGLRDSSYTRTQLAGITREINRLFLMPVMILFRHGQTLTLSVINRRLHKRDESRDILEKVTLIKDIVFADPHRAHIEILYDLSLAQLYETHQFTDFLGLHNAWQKTLDSSELNKRFFSEVANWYFWAVQTVRFPRGADKDEETRNATSVIRTITRLIFVWFLKEKRLVPDDLFNPRRIKELLKPSAPKDSAYYKAILQNLFFATLNQEMNTPEKPKNRMFRSRSKQPGGRDQHYMIHNVYRHEDSFQNPEEILRLFSSIPFLNGGLFECLDRPDRDNPEKIIRVDGFSDHPKNELSVPDFLFFSDEKNIDLNEMYGTQNKRYKVRGLIDILSRYKFTVTENTPIEEEIALDPELLGRVFENLLAAYNPETGVTARKQTGSFYTPREIVDYMGDESLIAYLETKLLDTGSYATEAKQRDLNDRLRHLFAYNDEPHRFSEEEVSRLIEAIDTAKILDPACGSGAFPMGVLHKLVFILAKLDPGNERWKEKQIAKAGEIPDSTVRERVIADIEQAFEGNELDYGRKLYLIENGIYGVDIQPIAVQIAKLRCFISLIVDQKIEDAAENRGVRPLPNLETKFVAGNTLFSLEKPEQLILRNPAIDAKEKELAEVRRKHFTARTPRTKEKCREQDRALRDKISALLKKDGFPGETTKKLAYWDPYGQNISADFFDPEWMFGLTDGFDVLIGNPPYVRQEQIKELKPALQEQYTCYTGVADLYVYFYERGFQLLREGGILTYISSNKYFRSGYGENLRQFLGSKSTIHHLIDFGDAPVFTAIAYPSIIILSKPSSHRQDACVTRNVKVAQVSSLPSDHRQDGHRQDATHNVRALTWEPGPPIEEFASIFQANSFFIVQKELKSDGWRLESPAVLRLLEKLRNAGKPLGEYVNGRFYYGIKTGLNKAFVVDRATRDRLIAEHKSSAEVLKPFLRGRDVKRWYIDNPDLFLCYVGWELPIKKYPAIYEHLKNFETELKARPEVKEGRVPWYALSRYASDYWQEFEQPKIVIPAIAQNVEYAPDRAGYFTNDKTSICVAKDVNYLLGLLNSKLLWWFIQRTAATKQGGFYEFKPMYVSQIPIPTNSKPKPIEALVEKILAARSADPDTDVSALERKIDEQVYRLYGLTAKEVAIVEEAMSQEEGKQTRERSKRRGQAKSPA